MIDEMLEDDIAADNRREIPVPLISLVIPVLNEEEAIEPFIETVDAQFAASWPDANNRPPIEMIFVDDGSRDGTSDVVTRLCGQDSRVKLIRLSRNFGKEAALSAGLHASQGDAVIPMDVDLQDPPELIRPMVDKWLAGSKIVNAKRSDRSRDTFFKRASSQAFYRTINKIADHPIAEDVGDFRLLDRQAVDVLNSMTERSRFNKGLFSWIGFETETVEYARPARLDGDTKWSISKLITLGLDGITSSTTFPLRIWTLIGATIAFFAFCYAATIVIYTIMTGGDVPGYASIMVAVLFLGGLNLLSLGLMGEYVGRIAIQVRDRPLYIISSVEGF